MRASIKLSLVHLVFLGVAACSAIPGCAQRQTALSAADEPGAAHRTRLILKDGSYQVVMSYRVQGDRVVFISAERGGAQEEIPLKLIDLDATRRWEREHLAHGSVDAPVQGSSAIDPELLKEEERSRARTPEVAPDLRLPDQDSVLALDVFRGTQELVPLGQSSGDLNRTTSHNVLRGMINPMSSPHQILELRGESAAAQLHVNEPAMYIRAVDLPDSEAAGGALTVDTHGASSASVNRGAIPEANSRYVIVRTDVRRDVRVVTSFQTGSLGDKRQQQDVVPTDMQLLPGGQWIKLTPRTPLSFGEYALVEVISPKEINLAVWDFGVHPTAPENRDALKPEPRRPASLERR